MLNTKNRMYTWTQIEIYKIYEEKCTFQTFTIYVYLGRYAGKPQITYTRTHM